MMALLLALVLQQAAAKPADHEYTDLLKVNLPEVYNKYVAEHQVSEAEKKDLKELFQFKDFVGTSMDGKYVNFHQSKEKGYKSAKVLIMTYIADWCPNCK